MHHHTYKNEPGRIWMQLPVVVQISTDTKAYELALNSSEKRPVGGEDGAETSRHAEALFLPVEVQGEVGSFCVAAQGAAEGLLA